MSLKPVAFATFLLAFSFSSLCQIAPGTSDVIRQHLRNAQQYLTQKRPDLAIHEFESALALDPANLDAQANLGVLLYFRRDFAKAAPHLRAAVKGRPDLWKIQALLGLAEYHLKDASNARADLESALPHLKGERVQVEVGNALVESYTATGDLEKAARTVSMMLESQPTDSGLLLMSYRLYSDLANKAMLTLAMAAPDSAEMHQALAIELSRRGDHAAALANYREAIRINPRLPGLYFQFGNLLYSSTDQKLQSEAEAQFRAALDVNQQDEKAQLMLGLVAKRRGDLKAAYEAVARAVEMQPDDALALLKESLSWVARLAGAYTKPFEKTLLKSKGLIFLTAYVLSHAQATKVRGLRWMGVDKELAGLASLVTERAWSPSDLRAKLRKFEKDHPRLYKLLVCKLDELHGFHAGR